MALSSGRPINRFPELWIMPPDIVVVQYVSGGRKYVVPGSPQSRRQGDLLAHKYPRQQRVERHLVQKLPSYEIEPRCNKGA